MLLRLRHVRRFPNCLKYIASALVAIFYFTFLFRQSLNAYEQKKDKIAGLTLNQEFPPKSKRVSILQHLKLHQLQEQGEQRKQLNELNDYTESPNVIIISTLNPIYEYSEELHSATEKELKERNAHLNAVCQHYKLQSHYEPNPREFFISPGHNLVWCNVFKAASSTWLYYFNILGRYQIEFLQRSNRQPLRLARSRFPRPTITELYESLLNSISFLFVRDPFERILSAYRDKFEKGRNLYYRQYAKKIIKTVRKQLGTNSVHPELHPTFPEFVTFIIHQFKMDKTFDEHWAPIYKFCTPCSINFTIIGKIETFQRDTEYIIRQAGLESLLLAKIPKDKERIISNRLARKTEELIEEYYSQLDRKTLDELLNIYRLDFELFNYDINKYYKIVLGSKTTKQDTAENTTTTVNVNLNSFSSTSYVTNS